ncbi:MULTISPECIES: DUF2760 domain-containing protein [unclassified Aliivibrio]|uniref:DUF2760 domain-containing protein n=1 Tax=unclassified Aliivibrio TaxID=2645654 RepID=UPI00080EE38E|nr:MULTISPECIES: DUF2760 domain-containing protein [unclassified Aliivibrio]OCH12297.1 hypothetical protein A6E03_18885 [Aliivibrio sp. 1S128]OCH15962.1 hypothetical protein A6E05_18130 [Aliivibrio sp. 1S165]OCH35140.1 hypothetical protein A6E06_14350 [Aliivibrio sp. 1S175]
MNFDLNTIPSTFDLGHIVLFGTSALFALLYATKKGKNVEVEKIVEIEKEKIIEKPVEKIVEIEKIIEVEKIIEKIIEVEPKVKATTPESALQLLSLLQKEARFIDFMQEDLKGFADAEVGAAARVIHDGGQKVLSEYFTLVPVRTEEEESRLSIPAGFNPSEVRLTGNVVGEAPFNGTLIHRGWKVAEVKLPKLADGYDATIVAPAEVEL